MRLHFVMPLSTQWDSQSCEKFKAADELKKRYTGLPTVFFTSTDVSFATDNSRIPDKDQTMFTIRRATCDVRDAARCQICGTPWKSMRRNNSRIGVHLSFWSFNDATVFVFVYVLLVMCSKLKRSEGLLFLKSTQLRRKCWYNVSCVSSYFLAAHFKNNPSCTLIALKWMWMIWLTCSLRCTKEVAIKSKWGPRATHIHSGESLRKMLDQFSAPIKTTLM